MAKYTYTNEQGNKRTISKVEEAKKVIIATATIREHSRQEILEDTQIMELAKVFGLNLEEDLVVMKSDNPNDFFYSYHFE